jgi:surface carbohydrate biosynthesis protein
MKKGKIIQVKSLYLPIEIKQREYDAQIVLAVNAALKGYHVYLGSHAAVFALLRNKTVPSGIYFDKGMPSPERLTWLRSRCKEIWVMDAEVSPIHNSEVLARELPSRIYPQGIKLIDRYLVVGDEAYVAACKFFEGEHRKVFKSGWPRLEILEPPYKKIYEKEVRSIKRKFPEFLLFASSFGAIRNPEEVENLRSATLHTATPYWSKSMLQKRYENFLYTIQCLRKWDEDPRIPTIVVRPHVSESKEIWLKNLSGLTKTFVENTGNATSWINGSSGVIHQGSTLSIQSSILNKELFFLKGASLDEYSSMPELISQAIVDLFNPPLPQTLLDKSQANSQYSPQILRSIVYNPPGGVIAVILEEMDKIAEHAERGTTRWKLIASQLQLRSVRRGMGLLRDEIYWKLGLINIHPQSKSIPRGLGKKEIKRVLNSLNYSNTVRASRQSLNLWEISAR